MIATSVRMMGEAPSVDLARITDPTGKILFVSEGDTQTESLAGAEIAKIAARPRGLRDDKPQVFDSGAGHWESVKPIFVQGKLYGYAWIRTDRSWDQEQITAIRTSVWIFGLIWITASILLGWALARSITRPLDILHRGTRSLMQSPEGAANFPLPDKGHNEIADLIQAFNRMIASIEEQRTGLSDTLSLLDSMLANAPIGLAFFDRQLRFVRGEPHLFRGDWIASQPPPG